MCLFRMDLDPIIHQTKFLSFFSISFKVASHHLEFTALKDKKKKKLKAARNHVGATVFPAGRKTFYFAFFSILPVVCGCLSQGSEEQSSNASGVNRAQGHVCLCVCVCLCVGHCTEILFDCHSDSIVKDSTVASREQQSVYCNTELRRCAFIPLAPLGCAATCQETIKNPLW